ncbi:MAG: ABC transporter permease, partial [Firmicutes bacterium HGW-Firmicutes-17]
MKFIKNLGELFQTRSDFFIELLLQHIVLSLIAIVIITVVGVATGIMISKSKKAASVVIGLTNVLYTIPSIAMFGFFVSITGIGNTTAIIALVIYGLLPVIRNTYVGLIEVDDQILEAAVGMGSTPWQLLSKIQFPLALPVIIAGIR